MKKIIFEIYDRYTASHYRPITKNAIMIRILEPRGEDLYLLYPEKYKNILEVRFDDITEEIEDERYKDMFKLFNEDNFKDILEFIKNNEFEELIVHCNAGVSRSAAIMISLMKLINREDVVEEIIKSGRYVPNKLVLERFNEYAKGIKLSGYEDFMFTSDSLENWNLK